MVPSPEEGAGGWCYAEREINSSTISTISTSSTSASVVTSAITLGWTSWSVWLSVDHGIRVHLTWRLIHLHAIINSESIRTINNLGTRVSVVIRAVVIRDTLTGEIWAGSGGWVGGEGLAGRRVIGATLGTWTGWDRRDRWRRCWWRWSKVLWCDFTWLDEDLENVAISLLPH